MGQNSFLSGILLSKSIRNLLLLLIALILIGFLFSYKLLEIPGELTSDEAAFGYNGVLLSETLHDRWGRFLPVFVLTRERTLWYEPITQYYLVSLFKVFGPSVFLLRFSSVIVTLASTILIFILSKELLGKTAAFLAAFLFLTTPILMIQSHMGMDNIMPIPFVILWLLSLLYFQRKGNLEYLLLAGIFLGFGFYSYKGMRGMVPVFLLISLIYLKFSFKDSLTVFLKRTGYLILGIAPFIAIIPFLEAKYSGAVFNRYQFSWEGVYSFLYPFFSSFDPTFLFIKGDALSIHSTGRHGMMLLSSLPLFIIGSYQAVKKRNFWLLILAAFFLAPFLYGLVNSVHRASRLMAIIPPYVLISTLGGVWLWQTKIKNVFINTKVLLAAIIVLMIVNYYDFTSYYWFTYPKVTHQENKLLVYKSYQALAEQAKQRGLTPYLSSNLDDGDSGLFFEAIYFDQPIGRWTDGRDTLPSGSILLSERKEIPGFKRLEVDLPYRHLQIYPK